MRSRRDHQCSRQVLPWEPPHRLSCIWPSEPDKVLATSLNTCRPVCLSWLGGRPPVRELDTPAHRRDAKGSAECFPSKLPQPKTSADGAQRPHRQPAVSAPRWSPSVTRHLTLERTPT